MALSVGFIRFVSSTDATQAKELLTFTPVGLPPTEHANLSFWTHCSAKTPYAAEKRGCGDQNLATVGQLPMAELRMP